MPPPTQDLESPPHPEVELLLPGETPLTGQSSEGRNEGASGPGAQQPSGEPGEEGTLTLGLHPWGEDRGG